MNKIFHLVTLGLLSLPAPVVADCYRATPDYLPNVIQQPVFVDGTGITRWSANVNNAVIKPFTRDAADTQKGYSKRDADDVTTGQLRTRYGIQHNKYLPVRF